MVASSSELAFLPAREVVRLIRDREISPVEAFDAVADRIQRHNGSLKAFITLDLGRAREEAIRRADEPSRGPLHGVPVAIKDDLAVAGLPHTCGSLLRAHEIARTDDLTVARLRQAGAIILGKTNEPEFGHKGTTDNRLLGVTPTPWDLTRTSGGSSGGSACAVASGMAYLALGTDVAGSIRIPAACCGVVGLKPSLGRVPRVPGYNAFVTQWFIGPLARTCSDVALAMSVLSGPDDRDPFSLPVREDEFSAAGDLAGVRVRWCRRPTGIEPDPAVAESAESASRLLERCGATWSVREEPLPLPPLDALLVIFRAVSLADAGLTSEEAFRAARPQLTDTFAEFVQPGLRLTLIDYLAAQGAITTFLETSAPEYWADCDVLATPTMTVPPFSAQLPLGPSRVGEQVIDPHVDWMNTWPFNVTGQPALSLPCGWTADGLPLGLQLVARRGDDGLLLRVAAAIESMNPWSHRRPPLR